MKPKSNSIFHFTKNLEVLKAILKSGFWPRYCLEDMLLLTENLHDFVAFPMVCFCDIPLSRIDEHIGFYGKFGIGMTRKWAEQNGLNPILYASGSNNLTKELLALNGHINKLEKRLQQDAKITTRYIYGHVKPTTGMMVVAGTPVSKDFYQECEWRFIPQHPEITSYLRRDQFIDETKLEEENSKTLKLSLLKFEPSDVKYIFVEKDSDIPAIMNFIQAELDGHTASALKILSSRILSLESFGGDL